MVLVPTPGDLVFAHSKGLIARAIRFAERHDNGKDAKWNHVAVLDRIEGGEWLIIQAEAKGVTNHHTLLSIAPGGVYQIVPLPADVDRDKFLEFARSQVGKKYGFLTIVSCALDMYLPDSVCLRKSGTWICSGLVAGALWFGGFKKAFAWPDLYTVTPSQIAALTIVLE